MEQRYDPRYPSDFAVWVTDLLKDGHSAAGTMRDISNSGVCVVTPLALAAGDIVRLDVEDSVLFGIVTYATAEESGSSRAGIEIQKALVGGSELSQLLQQVLDESMPAVTQRSRI